MGSFYMEATQINYRRDETVKTVDQKLQELSEESAVDTDIAPVFSKTATYNPGDMVYYKNKLYVCNTQHSGAWAAADFAATTVSARITASDEEKADYTDLAPAFSSESSYDAGDLVTYLGKVYRCTNDHTGDWDADDFSATTISAELGSLKSGLNDLTGVAVKKYTISANNSLFAFITNEGNPAQSAYIIDITNATDNPFTAGAPAMAVVLKKWANGAYSQVFAYGGTRGSVSFKTADVIYQNDTEISWAT